MTATTVYLLSCELRLLLYHQDLPTNSAYVIHITVVVIVRIAIFQLVPSITLSSVLLFACSVDLFYVLSSTKPHEVPAFKKFFFKNLKHEKGKTVRHLSSSSSTYVPITERNFESLVCVGACLLRLVYPPGLMYFLVDLFGLKRGFLF